MNATSVDEEFNPSVHVYEPHKVGLPPLRPYFKALWERREFAAEMSRTGIRAANTNTFFGQVWLVLNPLMLAGVYYILVEIISGGGKGDGSARFAHMCGGLFAFYYFSGAMTTAASSVVGGGKLLMNMSFPRMLLPLSALRTAFFRFLPTLIVYAAIHLLMRQPLHWAMLLAPSFLVLLTIFAAGMGMIFAAIQVYFRDTTSFLPYFVRIWLYLSPVLWFAEDAPERFRRFIVYNPLYSLIGGWTDLLVRGTIPDPEMWIGGVLWAAAAALVGALFFMSREREFVVRL
ncbi:teichoic acid transport system permease protein [Kribbella orskensis]|uniref:Teichoic acid transport system permease protein n=1 Tax=Kribbella orskensis TaxID=2512216 RepID=A0ABY2BJW1_9ACTN|nr:MULTISPECIES: ABC transporter permease [Kribbella]TCN39276.1 teichoic acid transport system permease protein [Kribbella sp. VKM Ac-2500]TCO21923.1 teichoic acid transport system permease protein [Kribbella orskensis]